MTTAADTRHAALWIEQDGRWQRHELPTDDGWASTFASCTEVAGTIAIDGSMGSRSEQWNWTPQVGFTELDPPTLDDGSASANRDGREFRGIVPIPGGYAAVGRLDARNYTGPVIWLSGDGRSWEWLPLPASRPDAWALTAGVGADLIAMTSSATGSQAWRIADVASVVASIPAGS